MRRLSFLPRQWLGRSSAGPADLLLVGLLLTAICALVVPLPGWALDVGVAANLAVAVAMLVASLGARSPLELAAFPTLLLLSTLARLATSVASSRAALSTGHAGDVIAAFGAFVVQGDFVVGGAVFAIISIVQLLVVTKGAERVAEVSARFTLDGIPGKQMSIDADLRSGAIGHDEARARRTELERESQLFGAMDGAMKFVKGDAIASLVIAAVNLVGGTAVGALRDGLPLADAAADFAILAIGDGLVAQLPSLCVSVAAGFVVTRVAPAASGGSLARELLAQLLGERTLGALAALFLVLALLPEMPHGLLGGLGLACAGGALWLRRARASAPASSVERPGDAPGDAPLAAEGPRGHGSAGAGVPAALESGRVLAGLPSPLVLDLSAELSWLATDDGGRFVTGDLEALRDRLQAELGVRPPPFRVRTGAPLSDGEWSLLVDELPAARGVLPAGRAALSRGRLESGIGPWAERLLAERSTAAGPEGAGAPEADVEERTATARELLDAVAAALRRRCGRFLGLQELQSLLSSFEERAPVLVREALLKVPLPVMAEVLRRLLAEQVSIRDLRAILEALAAPGVDADAAALAERCRQALGRQLTHGHASDGRLVAWLVDPSIEERLRQASAFDALDPIEADAIVQGVRRIARGGRAVILGSPDIRRALRRLVEGPLPDVTVLSYAELDLELAVRPIGRLVPVERGT